MNTLNDTSRQDLFVQVGGVLLSLDYIRERALALLGTPFTLTNNNSQPTKTYHTIISGVLFERGNGSWSDSSFCGSSTPREALEDYFWRLKTARKVRKGNQEFMWDKEEMMYVEK